MPASALQQAVEEHLANLISIGFSHNQVSEKGYEYALALQTDKLAEDDQRISADMMARAAEVVKNALPGAYRIYELRNRMR